MTIDDAIHDRWAQMTDNGKLDGRVAILERACDDFFNQQHGRYNLTPESRGLFVAFRRSAVADLKRLIVTDPRIGKFARAAEDFFESLPDRSEH